MSSKACLWTAGAIFSVMLMIMFICCAATFANGAGWSVAGAVLSGLSMGVCGSLAVYTREPKKQTMQENEELNNMDPAYVAAQNDYSHHLETNHVQPQGDGNAPVAPGHNCDPRQPIQGSGGPGGVPLALLLAGGGALIIIPICCCCVFMLMKGGKSKNRGGLTRAEMMV